MRSFSLFVAALVGGIVVLIGVWLWQPVIKNTPRTTESSAFERVTSSQTLHCGYVIKPPFFEKDVNTGHFSGLVYDIMTEIGKTLGLKIDWKEEVSYATMLEGLKAKRYDAICAQLYPIPELMPILDFTSPYFFTPILVIQRKGETRFNSAADINKPGIKVASIDGTIAQKITQEEFRKAQNISLPDLTPYVDVLLSVETGKADVLFVDPVIFGIYAQQNPGKLEINKSVPPLRVYPNVFEVIKGEHDLVSMLSAAIQHLQNNGKIEQIIRSHEPAPNVIMRVAPPFAAQTK